MAALATFVEAAQRGSSAAVARDRGQDPSSISRVIVALEAELGVRLFPTHYRVVASPDYLAREGRIATPDDLGSRSSLLMSLPEFRSRWLLRRSGETLDVPVRGDVVISSALALRAAAVNGLGPALLADWLVRDDLAAGRLVDAMPDYEATATTFDTAAWLLYPSREYLPRKARSVMDFLRKSWP